MPKAMHHIALNCRDNAATEEFYKKWFGFARALKFEGPSGHPVIFIRLGDFYLELFKATEQGDGPDAKGPEVMGPQATGGEQPVGFKHFCLQVDGVRDYYERMKDEVEFTVTPVTPPALPHLTFVFFKDPDGNIVQLLEGWKEN